MGCCFNSSENNSLERPNAESNILDTRDTEAGSEIIEMRRTSLEDEQLQILRHIFAAIKANNLQKLENLFSQSNYIYTQLYF